MGETDRREVLRYLGYRGKQADEAVSGMVEECIGELEKSCNPKWAFREYPLYLGEDGWIDGGCFQTRSRNLWGNIKDCSRILVFGATLGIGSDHLIQRYSRIQMSKAVVMQAAAAAMIEAVCNEACQSLREEYEAKGLYLRPRFSPGYGDFSLECQEFLLRGLEADKRIGIKLTESLLMMPSKSVSAVIGVGEQPGRCDVRGCEVCQKKECLYRR